MDDNSRPSRPETPQINLPPEHSTINYEAQDEKDNAEYQVLWSNTMDKGKYKTSSSYTNVRVLLLRWAQSCTDLSVSEEVSRLKSTFETLFNYPTQVSYLDAKRKYQVQVNTIVQEFIGRHDHPNTLLIVYYAGHGRPGSYFGSLELHGQTSENDQRKQIDMLVWNKTEKLLADAEGDVLEIFDCCYAGNLCLTRGDPRLFEYLAATEQMATTPVPGQDSFTSALIYALEALVKEKGRFTTIELLNKIKNDAPNFPEDQTPVLSDRKDDIQAGRIMLHPLQRVQEDGSQNPLPRTEDTNLDVFKHQIVTLHLDFCKKPSHADIERLGQQMNQIFERHTLNVDRVRWGGMKRSVAARALGSFLQAGQKRIRRESMGQQQAILIDGGSESRPVQVLTPSSSWSNGSSPPRQMEVTVADDTAIDPTSLSPTMFPRSLGASEENHQGQIEDRRRQHKKQKSDVDIGDSS